MFMRDQTKAPIPESRFSTEQENVHAASNDQETNHAKVTIIGMKIICNKKMLL